MSAKQKIAVDATHLGKRSRGMGRFLLRFIEPLVDEVYYLCPSGKSEGIKVKNLIAQGTSFFPIWEQFVVPRIAKKNLFNWVVCPYNTCPIFKPRKVKYILVVHDLIFLKNIKELPVSLSMIQNLGRLYRRLILPVCIKKADKIVTVSEYSKAELVDKFSLHEKDVYVVPNCISSTFASRLDELETKGLTDESTPYILTVTGETASKNLSRLLKAFSVIKGDQGFDDLRLKVVGVKGSSQEYFLELCRSLSIENYVDFFDYIDDDDLIDLYINAKSFVFPSLYEGFGIPLLEAMSLGVPIVCSDTTSIPEVVGDAALMFNPESIDDMANKIAMLLSDEMLQDKFKQCALKQVAKFSENSVMNKVERFWDDV